MQRRDFSREYGTAIFELASEENCQKEVFDDIQGVADAFKRNPDFMRLVSNPRLGASERAEAIGKVFDGKINHNLLNALKLLAEKRRCDSIVGCCEVYKNLYCEANGISQVKAISAVELSEQQKARLIEKLCAKTGGEILLECKVDPSCIGGIRLEYQGKRLDISVKGRLERLGKAIKNAE